MVGRKLVLMIKVTVVMPSLNVTEYIAECLESVQNQTLKELEILCIDAGSIDGTKEIIERYASTDARIRLIHSDKKSYGYQVNLGIREAKGKYIGVVETDDFIAPAMYENLWKCAEEHQLDYVKEEFADTYSMGNKEYLKRRSVSWYDRNCYDRVIIQGELPERYFRDIYLWRGIYSREFLEEYEICLNESSGAAFQDVGFLFQTIAYARRCMYLKEVGYYYRRDNAGSSVYNPKGFGYLVQEYQFVKEKMRVDKEVWNRIEKFYYTRLFLQSRYRFMVMACSGKLWENAKEDILWIQKTLRKAHEEQKIDTEFLDYYAHLELPMVLGSEEEYFQYLKNMMDAKRYVLQEMLDAVKRRGNCVLFTCSKTSQFVDCVLRHRKVEIDVYCDNKEELWGTKCFGKQIISPKEATFKYPDAYYIVANAHFSQEMIEQLLSYGITRGQICVYKWGIDAFLMQI